MLFVINIRIFSPRLSVNLICENFNSNFLNYTSEPIYIQIAIFCNFKLVSVPEKLVYFKILVVFLLLAISCQLITFNMASVS